MVYQPNVLVISVRRLPGAYPTGSALGGEEIVKLTKQVVDGLRPKTDGTDLVRWDSELPGFGVRVKPSGVISYWSSIEIDRGARAG